MSGFPMASASKSTADSSWLFPRSTSPMRSTSTRTGVSVTRITRRSLSTARRVEPMVMVSFLARAVAGQADDATAPGGQHPAIV